MAMPADRLTRPEALEERCRHEAVLPSPYLFDGASHRAARGRTGRENDRGRLELHPKRSSRMRDVQGLGPKIDTTKLRATAQSFLAEMNSSEEFLNKMKPVDDEELATALINSSKEMAIALISALDVIDKHNVAIDLAMAEIAKLEGATPSESM